jgi:hypothetical protein
MSFFVCLWQSVVGSMTSPEAGGPTFVGYSAVIACSSEWSVYYFIFYYYYWWGGTESLGIY